jgi:zinc protease
MTMKTLRCVVAFVLLLAVSFSVGMGQKHPRDLKEPSALSFKPTKPQEFTLSNGIKVFFLEDRELPLVSFNGMLRGGTLYDPAGKEGLASLMGSVLRSGGSSILSGDAMDEELEFLASTVEANAGEEFFSVSANCLKKDLKRVSEIFADVIMHPLFAQEKFDLAKNQMKDRIRRRWDQPAQGSSMLFTEQVYGGTPYGRRTNFKSLNAISREDLADFHKRFFAPGNVFLAVSGDLSREEAKTLLESVFASWPKRNVVIPDIPPIAEKCDGTVYYAFKETPQANVVIGHLGIRRNTPDKLKVDVMNDIFGGGGFTARLMKEIRSNRGLTYGIYGGVFDGKDRGVFRIGSQLKADKAVEAVTLVRDMVKDLQTKLVTDEEIALTKKSLINSFVFNFESTDRIPQLYMQQWLEGYPADYYDTYVDRVKKVTKEEVLDCAKRYIDLNKMIIVIVGDEKRFDKPVATLGNVKLLDYKQISESDRQE